MCSASLLFTPCTVQSAERRARRTQSASNAERAERRARRTQTTDAVRRTQTTDAARRTPTTDAARRTPTTDADHRRRLRAQSTALRLRALSVGCRRGRPIAATLYTHSLIHFLYHDNVLSNKSNSRNYSITVLIFVPVTTPFSPEISERGGPPPEKILLLVIINSIKYINWRS